MFTLAALFILISSLALFALAADAFGVDSRDGYAGDRR